MIRIAAVLVLLASLAVSSCGKDGEPTADVEGVDQSRHRDATFPKWVLERAAPEQSEEAKKHGVPVGFENELGMRFLLVPAGTFLMGSPEDEQGRRFTIPPPGRKQSESDETQHKVTLTKPYYMQITEVANSEYGQFRPEAARPQQGQEDEWDARAPVTAISWKQAGAFARWLSDRDSKRTYELPTEAQWEYACRAGTTTPFSFGSTITPEQANYNGRFIYPDPDGREHPNGLFRGAPTTVGTFPPNAWGLHDMHGNVWEFCSDWYAEYPSGAAVDPEGPEPPPRTPEHLVLRWRVKRGGGWFTDPEWLRSAHRNRISPDYPGASDVGFRLVSPLPERRK